MPHKHRRTGQPKSQEYSYFDLPPTNGHATALPARDTLPSRSQPPRPIRKRERSNTLVISSYHEDDTPRAFARHMRFQKTGQGAPSGLDEAKPDGKKRSKKRTSRAEEEEKHDGAISVASATAPNAVHVAKMPKIQPGEPLSAFAARVDAALPVAGLKKKGKKAFDHSTGIGGAKLTRMERKMHRMQTDWREEEARRKARQEDEADEMEDDEEWVERLEMAKVLQETGSQKKKKRKRTAEHEDPWAAVKKARGEEGRQKSVMDVVQAPPKLGSVKDIFGVKDRDMGRPGVEIANVPAKSGSLRRREELSRARQDFVQQYRRTRARGVQL